MTVVAYNIVKGCKATVEVPTTCGMHENGVPTLICDRILAFGGKRNI